MQKLRIHFQCGDDMVRLFYTPDNSKVEHELQPVKRRLLPAALRAFTERPIELTVGPV